MNQKMTLTFPLRIMLFLIIIWPFFFTALAVAQEKQDSSLLLHAARVFDGETVKTGVSVLVVGGKVAQILPREAINTDDRAAVLDLGDATILPGLIELHAHLTYRKVPADIVLRHGITTIRDLGGPVHQPYGGDGNLRVLTSGPIITAPDGYPIAVLGATDIAIAVTDEEQARATVRRLISEGAAVIKVALEPGGEVGAPWSAHHDHGHHGTHDATHTGVHHPSAQHTTRTLTSWPVLSQSIVSAIVQEAHRHGRKVSAHVAEATGAQIALNAGVDEWAHLPCNHIPEPLLKQAIAQRVKIISTMDTLSKCAGIAANAAAWTTLGGELLYGAEIAHPDIPWGIDAQELLYLMQTANMHVLDVLRAATAKAGHHLGIPMLGSLQPGAPADIIAVAGNPLLDLKRLEYPGLVISGGRIIVNHFGIPD
ncbi:MAG: amidohydrolase family protein [Nitrosomonas sp.]|nr:MAG: amidohydrolase family protein [Nitrosomonas sp.]